MLLKMWLAFGDDLLTPGDVFRALTRGLTDGTGVIANSTVVLVRPEPVKQPSEKKCARKKFAPVFGIRAVAYTKFHKNGDIEFSQVRPHSISALVLYLCLTTPSVSLRTSLERLLPSVIPMDDIGLCLAGTLWR